MNSEILISTSKIKLSLYINSFWNGFIENIEGVNYNIFEKIIGSVFNAELNITSNLHNADILLETWYGPSVFNNKKWK